MTNPKREPAINITVDRTKATLSKGQKAFNKLVKEIEKRRAHLRAWDAVTPAFQKKYVEELFPRERLWDELRVKLVHRLDSIHDDKGLTRTERRMVSELVLDLLGALLEQAEGGEDAELEAIYSRHNRFGSNDYGDTAPPDLDLGDNLEAAAHKELLHQAFVQLEAQQRQQEDERQAQQERRAKRKKSASQLAAEARKDAERAQLSQSIRDVYRKLASALHPDRETDPRERERKTELMQRVNQAYGANNLLQLLELQLELEHVDQSAINEISEDRLKHYNKILKEQLGELDQEILRVENDLRYSYGIPPFIDIAPDTVLAEIAFGIKMYEEDIRGIEMDLLVFDNIKEFKRWLKEMKRRQADGSFDEMPF